MISVTRVINSLFAFTLSKCNYRFYMFLNSNFVDMINGEEDLVGNLAIAHIQTLELFSFDSIINQL